MRPKLILASASKTRRSMLDKAGVPFTAVAADLDEAAIKNHCHRGKKSAQETALALARAKAEKIAMQHPQDWVLGADQMLECEGHWFDKAQDRAQAEAQLAFLSGKTHRLITAAVLMKGDATWERIESASLTMRGLTPDFVKEYCDRLGQSLYGSVGCYALEGLGAQLFQKIEGDFFVILGLPLLPLLEALRERELL